MISLNFHKFALCIHFNLQIAISFKAHVCLLPFTSHLAATVSSQTVVPIKCMLSVLVEGNRNGDFCTLKMMEKYSYHNIWRSVIATYGKLTSEKNLLEYATYESCPSEAQQNWLVTVGFSMHKLPQCCV